VSPLWTALHLLALVLAPEMGWPRDLPPSVDDPICQGHFMDDPTIPPSHAIPPEDRQAPRQIEWDSSFVGPGELEDIRDNEGSDSAVQEVLSRCQAGPDVAESCPAWSEGAGPISLYLTLRRFRC
jgi:hypothetical protein